MLQEMGREARDRAGAATHTLKDRVLEKRLERTGQEAERLRLENGLLRDEMTEAKSEQARLIDLLGSRLEATDEEDGQDRRSHRARWLLMLGALGAGAFGWVRARRAGGDEEWIPQPNDEIPTKSTAAAA
jgi:hypothetical protein